MRASEGWSMMHPASRRVCKLFFFSSRSRHTRFDRDWSSDVCSSDLTHTAEGKAHRYVPAVTQRAAGGSALSRVLNKIFDGSTELLLTQLVSDRKLDPDELRRL